jgi:SAM-dependent methyltransferase
VTYVLGWRVTHGIVRSQADVGHFMTTSPDVWVYGDFAPNPASRDLVGLKARWLLEQLPAKDAPLVLDFGAGEGKHLHLIRKFRPQARLVGVDIRQAHTAVDFEFHHVAPNAALPLADDAFDLVMSCDVLEHVENIERSLDEIHRVLRSGGSFIGFVPTEGGLGPHALFRILDPNIYRDTKDHNHAFTRRELVKWLSSRFRIARLAYSYHLIGATLDAAFYASFKAPLIGPRMEKFWRGQENVFYRGHAAETKPSLLSRLVQLANGAAYYESRLLKHFPLGAKGLHFHVVKR